MGMYESGCWKRVDGTKYYIVAKSGTFLQTVRVRDGKWSHADDTLTMTTKFGWTNMDLEEQVAKTVENYISKKKREKEQTEEVEQKISRACERVDEIYSDDW